MYVKDLFCGLFFVPGSNPTTSTQHAVVGHIFATQIFLLTAMRLTEHRGVPHHTCTRAYPGNGFAVSASGIVSPMGARHVYHRGGDGDDDNDNDGDGDDAGGDDARGALFQTAKRPDDEWGRAAVGVQRRSRVNYIYLYIYTYV